MGRERWHRWLAYAWVVALSAAITGPALTPGFALSYDLVFTPRQDLLPASLGLGGGLPRAVPQDAVVALLETFIPGELLEKLILVGILVLAGTGMLRLLRTTSAGLVAATVAIANPFVAQRLVIGHWGLLLAYALVPWALAVAVRLRGTGDAWDGVRLLLIVAVGSLTPSGSLLITVVAIPPVLLPGSRIAPARRALIAAAAVAIWLPWLLPALLHPAAGVLDSDSIGVFAMHPDLRPEVPGGGVLSAVTGGGIWNADVVLPSRGSVLAWVFAVFVLGLAAWGARWLWRSLGRAVTGWWVLVAVAGLLAAVASASFAGPWEALIDTMPGGGLARDAHKLIGPWMLLVAAAAGEGGTRLAGLARDRGTRMTIIGAIVLVPIACQPDMLGGVGGRLQAVTYPQDWAEVRQALLDDPRPGDVASFPWTSFRQFDWNDGRTVLDPAPRWLPRTTVVADNLLVSTPTGIVDIAGEDPRAERIRAALVEGTSIDRLLPELGIGWALVARGTPTGAPDGIGIPDLSGWDLVVDGPDLALYAAPMEPAPRGRPEHLVLVAAVDVLIGLALLAGAVGLGLRRVRARHRPGLVP